MICFDCRISFLTSSFCQAVYVIESYGARLIGYLCSECLKKKEYQMTPQEKYK